MVLPQLVMDPKRKCGLCTACCTVLGVPEISKPHQTKCEHQCGDGCTIYEDRPSTCKGFFCAWRLGYFTEDDRPDRVGVVFAFQMGTKFQDGPLLVVDELRPEAYLETRPHALILQESRRQLVWVRSGRNRKLLGPDSELDRVQPIVDQELREHGFLKPDSLGNEST